MSELDVIQARASLQLPSTAPATTALQRASDGDGATCRLGDSSCAGAHAARVQRSSMDEGGLHRSLQRMQREHGNRFVGQVLRQAGGGEPVEAEGLAAVESSIEGARGGGQAMDHGIRRQMESSIGADFSGVRIHADSRADGLSQAISARAFTTGNDVFFRQGEYNPGSAAGRELLAHELTHVVQQNGTGLQRKMSISQPGDPQEKEADDMAAHVMRMEGAVQRQPEASPEDDDRKNHP